MVVTVVTVRLETRTPRAVKSQAIADLLAQFPGKEEFLLGITFEFLEVSECLDDLSKLP